MYLKQLWIWRCSWPFDFSMADARKEKGWTEWKNSKSRLQLRGFSKPCLQVMNKCLHAHRNTTGNRTGTEIGSLSIGIRVVIQVIVYCHAWRKDRRSMGARCQDGAAHRTCVAVMVFEIIGHHSHYGGQLRPWPRWPPPNSRPVHRCTCIPS